MPDQSPKPAKAKKTQRQPRSRAATPGPKGGDPLTPATYLASKRQPGGQIRTRAERRAEANQLIAGRDLAKLNARELASLRQTLGVAAPKGGESRGPSAKRALFRDLRVALGLTTSAET